MYYTDREKNSGDVMPVMSRASRYKASGGLTTHFAYAESTSNSGGIVCDHAAPPEGFHYEQRPGTTGSCNLVLKPNSTTGSGSGTGTGSGSGSTGSGSGTGTGSTGSGSGSGTPTPAAPIDFQKALLLAGLVWIVAQVLD